MVVLLVVLLVVVVGGSVTVVEVEKVGVVEVVVDVLHGVASHLPVTVLQALHAAQAGQVTTPLDCDMPTASPLSHSASAWPSVPITVERPATTSTC